MPVVAVGAKRELQHTESVGVARLAVWLGNAEGTKAFPAGTDDEFANAAARIRGAVRGLRSKALVVVVVAVDDHVGVGFVERIPERLHGQIVAMRAAGTEQGLVPIGQRASYPMRGEVGAKPSFLGRASFASTNAVALAVQHHDVPGAEFVAVVAGLVTAGKDAEIFKVRRGTRGMELMIARRGARAGTSAAPGFVVASEVFLASVRLSEVADGHDGSGNLSSNLEVASAPARVLQSAMSPAPARTAACSAFAGNGAKLGDSAFRVSKAVTRVINEVIALRLRFVLIG